MKLSFEWKRDVPTLLLAAENDAALPLAGMHEIYERVPATKRMVVLRRAGHAHFMDNVEREHEAFRTAPLPPVLKAMQQDMRRVERYSRISRGCRSQNARFGIRISP